MDVTEWRRRRAERGLTQAQVARATGTSPSNVSAYEVGSKTPSEATAARIEAAIEAGGSSPIHVHALLTVPACAAAIRKDLRGGRRSNGEMLRHVAEMRSHARKLREPADIRAFFAAPSTTGDRRWDTLVAAAVEDLAGQLGIQPPAWTDQPPLGTCWFVGSNPRLHAYAFARSPAALHARGIMLDPADLESV